MGMDPRGQASLYLGAQLRASAVISTTPTWFFGLSGYNNGPAQWIHLFNSTTVPADATAPYIAPIRIGGATNFFFDLGEKGYFFFTGLSWSNSTTLSTKTIGAADVWMDALYLPRRI